MSTIIKNIVLLAATLLASYSTAKYSGKIYSNFFEIVEAGFFAFTREASQFIIGLPLSYTFFLTLLFTLFGGGKKYWWIGILLIPAVAFELYFDLEHIYFPLALGFLGWLLGLVIIKARSAIKIKT